MPFIPSTVDVYEQNLCVRVAKNKLQMKRIILAFIVLLHLNQIHGATIIDSGVRRTDLLERLSLLWNVDAAKDIDGGSNECSSLISSNLVDEIRSYQPIVNQIVAAAVNSKFSGSTWNRLVALCSRCSISISFIQSFSIC